MTIDFEELQRKRKDLEEAEREYREQVKGRRAGVVKELAKLRTSIDALVREAEVLAESADLVFYYSKGYDQWDWQEKETWSSSSADC